MLRTGTDVRWLCHQSQFSFWINATAFAFLNDTVMHWYLHTLTIKKVYASTRCDGQLCVCETTMTIAFLHSVVIATVLTSLHDESTCDKQLRMWEDRATTILPMQQYLRPLMLRRSLANITGICVREMTMPAQLLFFSILNHPVDATILTHLLLCWCRGQHRMTWENPSPNYFDFNKYVQPLMMRATNRTLCDKRLHETVVIWKLQINETVSTYMLWCRRAVVHVRGPWNCPVNTTVLTSFDFELSQQHMSRALFL
jgi:hypothetical protein